MSRGGRFRNKIMVKSSCTHIVVHHREDIDRKW